MSYARFAALLFAVLMTACLMGCQGSTEEAGAAAEDLADPAAEAVEEAGQDLAEEVAKMTPEELQAKMEEVTRQIEEKEGKLKELADQLKALSPDDLAGEAGQKLQAGNDALTEEIDSLKEKVQAWTDARVE